MHSLNLGSVSLQESPAATWKLAYKLTEARKLGTITGLVYKNALRRITKPKETEFTSQFNSLLRMPELAKAIYDAVKIPALAASFTPNGFYKFGKPRLSSVRFKGS